MPVYYISCWEGSPSLRIRSFFCHSQQSAIRRRALNSDPPLRGDRKINWPSSRQSRSLLRELHDSSFELRLLVGHKASLATALQRKHTFCVDQVMSASPVPRRESPWGLPDGDTRQPQPHRCNDRAEDVVQACFEGNPFKTIPGPFKLFWQCMRSKPGEEPTEPFYYLQLDPPRREEVKLE